MEIFELFGSILLRDEGVEGKLDDIDKKAEKTGFSFGNLAKGAMVLGGALVGALGGALISGVKGTMEAEEATAQLDAVLKSTSGSAGVTRKSLLDYADSLEATTKFSAENVINAQSLLLTFTNIGEKVFPRATKATADMATAMGTDMASQSIALGKALNDPIKGVGALSRVGVTFTEGQKESIKAMQESGDMAGAQTIILKELEKEFGGSADAAGKTFAGQLEILKNGIGNVTEGLASGFMPYLQKFMDFVLKNMPTIQEIFSKAFEIMGKAITTVAGFISENIIPIFMKLYEWIKPNLPAISDFAVKAFTSIGDIFRVISTFVVDNVLPTFNKMKDKFIEVFPIIKEAVMKAYDYIKPSFDKLVQTIKDTVVPIFMGLWDTVKKAMPGIQAVFEIVFPILVFAVKTVIDIITVIIKTIKGIYDFIKPPLDSVASLFSTVFGGIKKVIEGVQWVLDIFNGTSMKNKEATVTTNYQNTGNPASFSNIGKNAEGTNNWRGGLTWVNELGGEIIDLPSGSRVIPHDVSMEMARNNSIPSALSRNGNAENMVQNITINADFSGVKSSDEIEKAFRNLAQRGKSSTSRYPY